jgi:3-phenylpropionate/trans-cinnamate dioxygenase ferredoxin subunit
MAQERVTVCHSDELPAGQRRLVKTSRGVIGVFNINGSYRAVKNVCPHAGAELCRGPISGTTEINASGEIVWAREDRILRCVWHGWEFDLEDGYTLTTPRIRVALFPVTVEGDEVVLYV